MQGFDIIELEHYSDARGFNTHPVDYKLLASGGVDNVHIVSLTPGAVRGNHVHHRQTEYFMLMGGPCRVVAKNMETGETFEHTHNPGDVVLYRADPGIAHVFKNIGDVEMFALCYSDLRYDPDNPDADRAPLLD